MNGQLKINISYLIRLNIWIKESNEWKVVLITPQGLFEPTVMFFGLTNSLAKQ